MIYIPSKIKVGYQKRNDTYTGMLAYIIYFDERNKLRKEASWESWRSKEIEPQEYDNTPTEGFVINKKAGGYRTDWGSRRTMARVYDPRGFEFEITMENLLYILENTNSYKGKGLEGTFVYGWSGTDLILVPTTSPDYEELQNFANKRANRDKITSKTLVPGGTYRTKGNNEYIYLGRFDCYEEDNYGYRDRKDGVLLGKRYFFYDGSFTHTSGLSNFIQVVSEEPVENYADLMDKLQCERNISPIDKEHVEYVDYTLDDFLEYVKIGRTYWYERNMYIRINGVLASVNIRIHNDRIDVYSSHTGSWFSEQGGLSPEEFVSKLKPCHRKLFLKNGKEYKGYYYSKEMV